MKHIKIDFENDKVETTLKLPLEELKMLYNACVDILNDHPNMTGYRRTATKLRAVIDGESFEDGGHQKNNIDLWLVSNISIWAGEPAYQENERIIWMLENGSEIMIDTETDDAFFTDWTGDMKSYFAISGILMTRGYEIHDMFSCPKNDC
jgi:hypothetical protein